LNLPPCLNCERSVFSFSTASLISVSKALKSKGSSEPTAGAAAEDEDVEEEESEREASRAALPPFLYVGGVLLKKRVVEAWYAVVAATRVDGLEMAIVSLVDLRSEGGWSNTGSYIVLQQRLPATAGANRAIVLIVWLAFFGMDGSFFAPVATSKPRKTECGKTVTSARNQAERWPDPVLVANLPETSLDRQTIYWCWCWGEHAKARNGNANLIDLQLVVYLYKAQNININITGMLFEGSSANAIAKAH
jgi:hypothetical protein